jgi:hypothetical protein
VVPNTPIATNIFPGREACAHMIIHSSLDQSCRKPLDYNPNLNLPGLMTLKSFIQGGNEVESCKILVCVKSIGAKKTITTKNGAELELLELVVFDDTADIIMKLWGAMIVTAKEWKASETILLISSPGFRVEYSGKGSVGLTHSTLVDINPDFVDAHWLLKYATTAHKVESTKQDFPDGIFDKEATLNARYRPLFTIADVDEW